MDLEDLKKTVEATVGALTPDRARQIAKSMMEPGAAKDQVAKAAADLLEWSARGRDRVVEVARREVRDQLRGMGLATQQEVDALRKRVRELERSSGGGSRSSSTKKTATKKTSGAKASARRSTAKRTPAKRSAASGGSAGAASARRGGSS
jgi:polyhydroxyalkanoate synthesis regulator phasin